MKNLINSLKKLINPWVQIRIFVYAMGVVIVAGCGMIGIDKTIDFIKNPIGVEAAENSIAIVRSEKEKEYEYNERVPAEIIKNEIISLSNRFDLDADCFDRIVFCESGYNNLAKNPDSSALGPCQYLNGTWEQTESFKQFKYARTDYKPSLWEMALDLANGEYSKWNESRGCWIEYCKTK